MIILGMGTAVSRTEPGTTPSHNLPAPLTSMVGRTRELKGVADLLRRARLVTVTGPGGVGKTRLALELARGQMARQRHGVWLVDLASVAKGADPAAELARVLEVRDPRGTTATDSLRRHLANRDLLLVLDNCEHVVEACAELGMGLLASCAGVRIIATSREPFGVAGETVWRLEPLEHEDARHLFVERARARKPELVPDAEMDATIGDLCERLDRLPLAIELAAARVTLMSPAELLESLRSRIELGAPSRLVPRRHRTVRAAVEWSYELLDPDEQAVFRSLAVFVGGFDARAAQAVAPSLSIDLLARLIDKSLVAATQTARGRTRYRLLETMREYANELLVEAGEIDATRERHFRHFRQLGDSGRYGWPSLGAEVFIADHHDDYENVRAALEWASSADPCSGIRMFASTRDLFMILAPADGHRLAEALLERCPTRDSYRAQAQITTGLLAMLLVDVPGARSSLTAARQLSAELGDRELEGWALLVDGLTAALAGMIEPARKSLQAALDLHRPLGIRRGEARALAVLGLTFHIEGEPERARQLAEEALAIYEDEGDGWGQGQANVYLGIVAESAGDLRRAGSLFLRAVECLRPFGVGPLLPFALVGQAGVLVDEDPERALEITAAGHDLRARTGGDFPPVFRAITDRIKRAAEAAVGDRAAAIWARGARLGADEAIALAFGQPKRSRPAPAGLSSRELEVVRLVAQGLANKAIAAQLHLSVRTVESHVRHVLAKVRLDNRIQLATWARERIQ